VSPVSCDTHVGEAHPPRCGACDSLTNEYRALGLLISDEKPARRTPAAQYHSTTPRTAEIVKEVTSS
jgi:hypothetical protein